MNLTPKDPSLEEFRAAVSGADEEIDLGRAALVIAKTEYPDLDIDPFLENLDALAAKLAARAGADADPADRVEALARILFKEMGLRGARDNYNDPRNSFLNDVFERKLGIPVSLSIIFMAVAARAGLAVGGTAMPMHFLVRVLGVRPARFVDCYGGGRVMSWEDCQEALRQMTRGKAELQGEMLDVVSSGAVLTRMLTNLKMIYLNDLQNARALPILDRLLALNPGETSLLRERGLVRFRLGQGELARIDLQNYLASEINAPDAQEIRNLLRRIG